MTSIPAYRPLSSPSPRPIGETPMKITDLQEVIDHDGRTLHFRSFELNVQSAFGSILFLPVLIALAPVAIVLDGPRDWARRVVQIAVSIPKDLFIDAPRHLLNGLTADK